MDDVPIDPYISCPYDIKHRVPRSRIQAHIIKCEKKHPPLKICPYNATHRFPSDQIQQHLDICPSKKEFYPTHPVLTGSITKPKPILQREYLPETDPNHEEWDN